MSKIAMIVRSDGHSGHREGHCSPDTELTDDVPMHGREGKHKVNLTAVQQAIWEVGQEAILWTKNNCRGYKKVYLDLGEVMQGNKHTDNLQTSDIDEQKAIAVTLSNRFSRYVTAHGLCRLRHGMKEVMALTRRQLCQS